MCKRSRRVAFFAAQSDVETAAGVHGSRCCLAGRDDSLLVAVALFCVPVTAVVSADAEPTASHSLELEALPRGFLQPGREPLAAI